jgi:hypothetical protein
VTEKFKKPEQKTGQGLDLSPPTAELVPIASSTPLPFNNTIAKDDENDKFGKNHLIIALKNLLFLYQKVKVINS